MFVKVVVLGLWLGLFVVRGGVLPGSRRGILRVGSITSYFEGFGRIRGKVRGLRTSPGPCIPKGFVFEKISSRGCRILSDTKQQLGRLGGRGSFVHCRIGLISGTEGVKCNGLSLRARLSSLRVLTRVRRLNKTAYLASFAAGFLVTL